ncbi:MAG: hypothetical protein INR73_25020 [Williamsia sp.]|nr:hypothetical protein [Williamsia sp.]
MSREYIFKCNKCNEYGGTYTRQVWGWGNFYVVESFKFLAYHTERCGPEYIRVVKEEDVPCDRAEPEKRMKYLKKTKKFFPHFERAFADGTKFDLFNPQELKKEWYKREMQEAKKTYQATLPLDYDTAIKVWESKKEQKEREIREFFVLLGTDLTSEELNHILEEDRQMWISMKVRTDQRKK